MKKNWGIYEMYVRKREKKDRETWWVWIAAEKSG